MSEVIGRMIQDENGYWLAAHSGDGTIIGPDSSHQVIVLLFREKYGDNVPLLSDYRNMD